MKRRNAHHHILLFYFFFFVLLFLYNLTSYVWAFSLFFINLCPNRCQMLKEKENENSFSKLKKEKERRSSTYFLFFFMNVLDLMSSFSLSLENERGNACRYSPDSFGERKAYARSRALSLSLSKGISKGLILTGIFLFITRPFP